LASLKKSIEKRILVAGGAGFLGFHLCVALLEKGYEVLCLDNFSTGRKANIVPMLSNPFFEFVRHDITSPYSAEVDEIYNLASPASPVHYQFDPVQTVKTNVHGVINLLDLAFRIKAKILQASTSEIYGDPEEHPQKESYWGSVNPIGIRSCYDEGKRCAETLFFDYHRQYAVPIKIVRIFNTYGPNMLMNDGRVVSNFILQALKNEDITIFGDGSQTRSFCYVTDMIEGMVAAMEKSGENPGPFNIGNPDEITILELAEKIISITESKARVVFHPLPSDDPRKRKPDISVAQKTFQWSPKVNLEDGLKETARYFRNLIY